MFSSGKKESKITKCKQRCGIKTPTDPGVSVNILCSEKDENHSLYSRFHYIHVRTKWVLLYILAGKWMLIINLKVFITSES